MLVRRAIHPIGLALIALGVGCSSDGARVFAPRDGGATPCDGGSCAPPGPCTDQDRDGLSDFIEGAPATDTDGDGTPDFRDTDSDDDGFSDAVEATRAYPGFAAQARSLSCGGSSDNCDGAPDGRANFRDTDSDDDGLTDREEAAAHTDPCAADTDGDGASDLVETAARSDGADASSRPPANGLYVILPYYPAPASGPHERREFTFATRIRLADVFFLVDNSASMEPVIDVLNRSFQTDIVPRIRAAIPDIRVGVGSFDSMPFFDVALGSSGQPGNPGDYTLWVRQRVHADTTLSQRAFSVMHTISADTGGRVVGGDHAEDQTEAAYEVIAGTGTRFPAPNIPSAARRSVHNALDPSGNGWVPPFDPAMDCDAGPDDHVYGFGCFAEGRVPIVVLASDSTWYDGCDDESPVSGGRGHRCAELVEALNRREAFFIGIDVGPGQETYANAVAVATRTNSVDERGRPLAFNPGPSGIPVTAAQVVNAITTIAGQTRQDITTRTAPDAAERRLPPGRSTADFVHAVTPARGIPDAPEGFARSDATTFYDVAPSTSVVFDADFYNDVQPAGPAAQLFQATIEVVGRARSVVDSRPVFIVVPALGAGMPPG